MNLENVLKTFQREFMLAAIKTGEAESNEASMELAVKISMAYVNAMAVGLPFAESEVQSWRLPFHESKVHAVLALAIAQMVRQMPPGPAPGVATLRQVYDTAIEAAPTAGSHIDIDWSNAERPDSLTAVSDAVATARSSEAPQLRPSTVRRLRQVRRDYSAADLERFIDMAGSDVGSDQLADPLRQVIEASVSQIAAGQPARIRTVVGSAIVTSYHVGRRLLGDEEPGRSLADSDLGRLGILAMLDPAAVFGESTVEPLYVEFLVRVFGSPPMSDLPEEVRQRLITAAAWLGLLLAVGEYDITRPPRDSPSSEEIASSASTQSTLRGSTADGPRRLLVDCEACGNAVSRIAVACPRCGHPVGTGNDDQAVSDEDDLASEPESTARAPDGPEEDLTAAGSSTRPAGGGWYTASISAAALAVFLGGGIGGFAWASALIGLLALTNGPKPHSRRWMATAALIAGVAFALVNAANLGHLDGLLATATDSEPTPDSSPGELPATQSSTPISDDGVLQVGTFLTLSGDNAEVGRTQLAAVRMAVDDINRAGGVLSDPIELIETATGPLPTPGSRRVLLNLAQQVDVVVGPTDNRTASEVLSASALEDLRASPIVVFSPSTNGFGLNRSDPWGYFFRAVPDIADVGRVMAGQIRLAHRGTYTVAVLATDDAFGRQSAIEFERRTRSLGGKLVSSVRYPVDGDDAAVRAAVEGIAAVTPDVVAVLTIQATPALVTALADYGLDPASGAELWATDEVSASVQVARSGAFDGMYVIAPLGDPDRVDPAFFSRLLDYSETPLTNELFAAEAYDIVVISALAAEMAGSTNQGELADSIEAVTNGSRSCSTFGSCLELLRAGHAIDYQGLAAPYDFDATGEPTLVQWAVTRFEIEPVGPPEVRFVLTDGSPYARR